MGFLGRLFGGRETEEQRVERARACIAADEPERVLRILMGVDSQDARDLIDLARHRIAARDGGAFAVASPDGNMVRVRGSGALTIAFGADGSQRIGDATSSIVLNAPRSDDDGRKRSADGLAVARRLIEQRAKDDRELEAPAFPFIEAVLLASRAGDPLPAIRNERARRLAAMASAAAARDDEQVVASAQGDRELESYVVPLVLPFAPAGAAAFAPHHVSVLREIGATDRILAEALLSDVPDDRVGEATLIAIDAGLDAEPLRARWPNIGAEPDARTAHPWRALQVRLLARTDLEAALALERELPQLYSHDDDASLAVAARLAQVDAERALAHATELGPDCYHLGWLLGCVRGAPDRAGALVDTWIDHLSAGTYHPYGFFRGVLEACLRLGDAARLRRLCERGGPTGWQVAHAARWDLGLAANRSELLAACLARYRPGCVSARARERAGFSTVGMAVTRPQWLELDDPHPVETLSIVAALGPDGPAWSSEALP